MENRANQEKVIKNDEYVLDKLQQEPQFCKCHRSYIVNLKHTGKISREGVEIDGKETLPISKSRWEALNHCYMEYYMA